MTKILYTNNTDRDISPLIDQINRNVKHVEEYDGGFTDLLHVAPHMAALNINDYNLLHMNLAVMYNDTMQHSLPILMNILSNAYYRYVN